MIAHPDEKFPDCFLYYFTTTYYTMRHGRLWCAEEDNKGAMSIYMGEWVSCKEKDRILFGEYC